MSEFEAVLLRDGCDISKETPNSAVFSLHKMIASLLGIFALVTQQPFGYVSYAPCSSLLALVHLIASTECKIGLIDHLAIEKRCDYRLVVLRIM